LQRINREGTSMLLTTHYMEEADHLCDTIAIIDDGKIVVEGTPRELKQSVGRDSVVLELAEPAGERSVDLVRGCVGDLVEADSVTAHPSGVALAVPNASAAIPALLRQLEGGGVTITGLRMKQPSLDDVFMRYTGHHIREEEADAYIPMGW
jgi:ABC-2 type transport system ATP-binding protein